MNSQNERRRMEWPAPVERINEEGDCPIILVCEHASNHIPAEYDGLGLAPSDLTRHIAWDIGAAAVARRLSALLDAPAFLGAYSRLLIDLNRPLDSATSIPVRSEATVIAGNHDLSPAERRRRQAMIFAPFQAAIAELLDRRAMTARPSILVAIHSFNPTFLGEPRPWHAGVLFGEAHALGHRLVAGLAREPELVVAANQPYSVSREEDYSILVHGDDRAIPAVLIELRNDGVATPAGVEAWVDRLAGLLLGEVAQMEAEVSR
jgi:predicted N-formylglutamate amidohydrolase